MSSRDFLRFKRWGEAFILPGLQKERWINRNNVIAWAPVETASCVGRRAVTPGDSAAHPCVCAW